MTLETIALTMTSDGCSAGIHIEKGDDMSALHAPHTAPNRDERQPVRAVRVMATAALCGLMVATPYAAVASPHPPWKPVHSPNPVAGAHATNQLTAVSCNKTSCVAVGVGKVGGHTSDELLRRHGTTWREGRPAGQFHGDGLAGVSCPTTNWCMAVGERKVADHGVVPAAQVITPSSARNANAGLPTRAADTPILTSISCRSTHFCIAVGSQVGESSLHASAVVERWNGHEWGAMPSPDPGLKVSYDGVAPIGVTLTAVRCRSTRSCIAVGNDLKVTSLPPMEQTSSHFTYAMRYNGHNWATTPTPDVSSTGTTSAPVRPDDGLVSLACPSTGECFATGNVMRGGARYGFVERYNGRLWSLSFAEGTVPLGLVAVACGSATSCDAPLVPSSGAATQDLTLEHWNGTSWSEAGTGTPIADSVNAVTCPSVAHCTAVGSNPTAGGSHTLVVRK
jgi:hypothetical protein